MKPNLWGLFPVFQALDIVRIPRLVKHTAAGHVTCTVLLGQGQETNSVPAYTASIHLSIELDAEETAQSEPQVLSCLLAINTAQYWLVPLI